MMRICAAWLLKPVAASSMLQQRQPSILMSGQCRLTPILRSLGRSFLVCTHIFYFTGADKTATRRDAAKSALDNAQRLQPNSPETLLALGYYQYWALRDYGLAKTTFEHVSKMLPSSSEAPMALGRIARREGHWDQSIAYQEQALGLDPRNVELLNDTAGTYATLRQFPKALKLFDRALDILPNDPTQLAAKALVYQAEGNLEQAAKLLSEITVQTPFEFVFVIKITQLRLERNYAEAVRLLQAATGSIPLRF
jgi:tetratricopeptide (TPR) repeat protein